MKKRKKVLAVFISGMLCAAAASGFSADARAVFDDAITAPEGYTRIDDQGTLEWLAWDGQTTRGYIVYQNLLGTETKTWLYLTNLFRYNYTELVVPIEAYDTYAAIYAEYETELDFEFCQENKTTQDTMTITLFDEQTADGTYSVNPADYTGKEDILISMCAQLKEADALKSAKYTAVLTISLYGTHNRIVNITGVPAGETDAIQTIVAQYDTDSTVTYAEEQYQVSSVEDYEDYIAIAAAVSAGYPDATVKMDEVLFQEDTNITEYGTTDLLTAGSDAELPTTTDSATLCGDINLDGAVDMADVVLLNKAVINVIDLPEGAKQNADCDLNETVDGTDATLLLKFLIHLIDQLPQQQ